VAPIEARFKFKPSPILRHNPRVSLVEASQVSRHLTKKTIAADVFAEIVQGRQFLSGPPRHGKSLPLEHRMLARLRKKKTVRGGENGPQTHPPASWEVSRPPYWAVLYSTSVFRAALLVSFLGGARYNNNISISNANNNYYRES